MQQEGEDYDRKDELIPEFEKEKISVSDNIINTIASGVAEYDPLEHSSMIEVFEEADRAMYECKQIMKGKRKAEEK